MDKKDAIKNAVSVVGAHGYALPDSLRKMVADIENPQYRVAVVGKYQVGKTTLINRVFLGGNSLLPGLSEGDGEIAETAVVTDVEYGETPKLEVYNWGERGGEVLVDAKENPTAADVRSATVADLEENRSQLAAKVSRVRLVFTNESLNGYVILDTPGLDDPNKQLLLNTTDRVIPSADLALVVVEPKQLDQIYDHLLRDELIGKGVSKLMILVSYHPEKHMLDSNGREDVITTITDQLKKIGREDVPVIMYCYDPAIDDKNVVNSVSELRMKLRDFLGKNALSGRLERVAFAVCQHLGTIELEIAAKIKSLGSTEAEKIALKEKVDAQIADFKATCERSFRRLQNEVESLKQDASVDVKRRVHKVFSDFADKIEQAPTIAGIRNHFERAEVDLKNDIVIEVDSVGKMIKAELSRLLDRYSDGLTDVLTSWNGLLCDELGIERPFLAKIPPIVFDAIFVAILNFVLPLGWLTAILAHLLGKKMFGLGPGMLLKPILLAQARGKIAEAEENACAQISAQINSNIETAFFKIKEGLEAYNKSQVTRMQKAVCADEASANRDELQKTKSAIATAIDLLK